MPKQIIFFLLFFFSVESFSQSIFIAGYIKDASTGEALIGASIYAIKARVGTSTNTYGYYSIQVSKQDSIRITYIGFQTKKLSIKDLQTFNIELIADSESLKEVVITAKKEQKLQLQGIGTINIPVERLKAIPALFGETDILKALSLTPGVMVAQEGTSGLLVRGGTPDQNLILLDDAPVYNVSHLFGLASVFNPDAVKNVTLYKSSFPARFGGRLASVIDIATKEGNQKERKTELTVGLISSRIYFEGPINKKLINKASYFVSARSSYLNLLTIPSYYKYRVNGGSYFNYWLYDVNAKLNFEMKKRGKLFLSFYNGLDKYKVASSFIKAYESISNVGWSNQTATLRYIQPLNEKVFLKFTNLYTNYNYLINLKSTSPKANDLFFQSNSRISDLSSKLSLEILPNPQHEIRIGLEATRHRYQPVALSTSFPIDETNKKAINLISYANEQAGFIEDEWQALKFLKLNLGLRAVNFKPNKVNYQSLEPRAAINLLLHQNTAIKFGYARQKQFIHQLSNNAIGLPNDIWVPVTQNVLPQTASQFALGISKTIGNNIEVTIEAYRKEMENLIDTKTGENFLTNFEQTWETSIEKSGVGLARGLEVFVNKTSGRFTGWVSYTLARSQRKFENLNDGQWFDFNFDRRHSFAITSNYKFSNSKLDVSGSWVFQTGSPVTLPIASYYKKNEFNKFYQYEGIYDARNNFRMPNYHRLDLSINSTNYTMNKKIRKWTFGVYNAYNQTNPFYLSIRNTPLIDVKNNGTISGFDQKLIKNGVLPIIPFVSYSRGL